MSRIWAKLYLDSPSFRRVEKWEGAEVEVGALRMLSHAVSYFLFVSREGRRHHGLEEMVDC
jgi:hypothetical protein